MTDDPMRVRGVTYGPDGRPRSVEVEVEPGPIADALREGTLRGISLPPELEGTSWGTVDPPFPGVTMLADLHARRPGRPAEPVEFVPAPPTIRVCGIPDPSSIPPEVMRVLDELARACREAYGMGVEVEGSDGREVAREALETIRRYLA